MARRLLFINQINIRLLNRGVTAPVCPIVFNSFFLYIFSFNRNYVTTIFR